MGNLFFTDENKRAFAINLVRSPDDPIKAAMNTFPDDPGLALRVVKDYGWPDDEFVQDCMDEVRGDVAKASILPTKEEYAAKLWASVTDNGARISFDDRLKGYRLFAEVMSFIDKPLPAVTNVAVDNRRVMVVPSVGSDDDWALQLEKQQAKLIEHNE